MGPRHRELVWSSCHRDPDVERKGQSGRVCVNTRHAPRTGAGTRRRCETRRNRSAGPDRTSSRPAGLAKRMALRAMTLLDAPKPQPRLRFLTKPTSEQVKPASPPSQPVTPKPAPGSARRRRRRRAGGPIDNCSVLPAAGAAHVSTEVRRPTLGYRNL